ncbi:MAG: flagellar motor switch protein FliN [Calditrichaeota bacterium]|nr:flagellar motor switch protein FliN [Calditrichota bacterium]
MAEDVQELQTEQAQAEATNEASETQPQAETDAAAEPEVQKAEFENLETPEKKVDTNRKLEMLLDIVLPVSIELGRTRMYIKDILELERGSIIELDKMAGEPVDLYVNNKKMAEGEVVVVDKHFGIRITNLIDPADRIKKLGTPGE